MKTVKISNAETMKKAALLMKDPKKQRSALNLAATWAASERRGQGKPFVVWYELGLNATMYRRLADQVIELGQMLRTQARELAAELEGGGA